ncbi:outer membrane beta-barrel protein [Sphingomonas cavernae]|uniref:Outer membrane beta-barrel protein n=1 Tax=Sphingomonas cavernae TaxID=2320861 RepID=A0A418WR25_9SPHN|nr:outer membrane beta-barrel protein [Sphingomonas cavernae]RJF93646.1 hypothetical protein D3876_04900 [Sphingomonas cavernae]
MTWAARLLSALAAGTAAILIAPAAQAQRADEDEPISELPRPGYEPRNLRIGTAILSPEAEFGATYDDNIFATATAADDDVVFRLAPRARLTQQTPHLNLRMDAYASILRYAENGSEDTESYGISSSAQYRRDVHTLSGTFRYDRSFERRTDPEADFNLARPPSEIDLASAELRYAYRPGRFGVQLSAGADKANYLPQVDADRDQTSYRGAVRAFIEVSGGMDAFVEGFATKRDARTPVDRNGVDRDASTYGGNVGVQLDIADRVKGDIGLGVFRAEYQDPTITDRTGFSASGRIVWRPRVRTAITGQVFSGDVATIRGGASSRTDTSASLRVDQEVRHNLLMHAQLGVLDTKYRGLNGRNMTTLSGGVGAEYLINRSLSVKVDASYMDRSANQVTDEFNKFRLGVALRVRY